MFYIPPDAEITGLVALCDLRSKSEAEKFSRSLVIRQSDLVALISYAQAGVFEHYKYASAFRDRQPSHLVPTAEERAALGNNGLGALQAKAKKAMAKMSQMLRDRRHLSTHLFYTPDLAHWSLFYFDQRDISARENHWQHGPHVHFLSSAWVDLDACTVMEQIIDGATKFRAVHVRYSGGDEGARPARRSSATRSASRHKI